MLRRVKAPDEELGLAGGDEAVSKRISLSGKRALSLAKDRLVWRNMVE